MATPTIDFDSGWNRIRAAIKRLESALDGSFTSGKLFVNREYMDIYTCCYNMCTQRPPHNYSQNLYEAHEQSIVAYLESEVHTALTSKHDDFLLKELAKRWKNHCIMNKWLWKFFMYLDRYYVDQHNQPKLREAGTMAFKRMFMSFSVPVVDAALKVVDRERGGEIIDRSLVQTVVDVYVALGQSDLGFYNEHFQERLVTGTRQFYARQAAAWLSSDSTPEYLMKAESALEAEKLRAQAYLHASSEDVVLRTAETELLKKHQKALLEKTGSGVRAMLRNDKREDLARLFRLFGRVDGGLVPVARMVKEHFQERGLSIVRKREAAVAAAGKENASDPTFVRALLELHDNAKQMVEREFGSHSLFQKALKDAFELFVNKEVNSKHSNAEMVSTFCDRILKTGGARLTEEQVEDLLERVVQLFTFISNKDMFADHYRRQLSKRLLNQRSASNDAERSMISKLKLRCGAQFTGKMEGMLNDLKVGADHARAFDAHKEKQTEPLPYDFSVQVLTTGFWPSYKPMKVLLPASITKCQEMFAEYYAANTSHRKLQWVHTLGSALVRGHYKKGVKELQVTSLQMICLLHFNSAAQYGFKQLQEIMGLEEEVCKRLLHSLSCGKYSVLRKTPKSRSISTSDNFAFNETFTCRNRKIRIPMASLEDTATSKNVQQDRSIAIEAAAVRTMKARKVMTHQELVTEIITQLHFFRPNPKVIKRRIETLIEREYLERDTDKTNVYRYVA